MPPCFPFIIERAFTETFSDQPAEQDEEFQLEEEVEEVEEVAPVETDADAQTPAAAGEAFEEEEEDLETVRGERFSQPAQRQITSFLPIKLECEECSLR